MNTRIRDFTRAIDLIATNGTGPVRLQKPLYVELTPPCSNACPAGEDIRGKLSHGAIGNPEAYERANYIKVLQGFGTG